MAKFDLALAKKVERLDLDLSELVKTNKNSSFSVLSFKVFQ